MTCKLKFKIRLMKWCSRFTDRILNHDLLSISHCYCDWLWLNCCDFNIVCLISILDRCVMWSSESAQLIPERRDRSHYILAAASSFVCKPCIGKASIAGLSLPAEGMVLWVVLEHISPIQWSCKHFKSFTLPRFWWYEPSWCIPLTTMASSFAYEDISPWSQCIVQHNVLEVQHFNVAQLQKHLLDYISSHLIHRFFKYCCTLWDLGVAVVAQLMFAGHNWIKYWDSWRLSIRDIQALAPLKAFCTFPCIVQSEI